MPHFAVINQEGAVLRTGYCASEYINEQSSGTDIVVETSGEIDDESYYYSELGFVAYPTKPGPWALFDYTLEEWYDPRTVEDYYEEAQAIVRAFRDAVNLKRAAIIAAGTDVTVTGHEVTVAMQGRPEDQISLLGLLSGAQLRLNFRDSTTPMDFLDRNNVLHQLVPMQMIELWQKGAGFISAVYARSWVIKEMDPTTTDVDSVELWSLE